jgi:hypothetical protein
VFNFTHGSQDGQGGDQTDTGQLQQIGRLLTPHNRVCLSTIYTCGL